MKLFSVKSLTIILGLATIAFCVSTIVLAVEKNDLEEQLKEANDKLESMSTTTTPTTTIDPAVTTPNPSDSTPDISSSTLPNSSSTTSINPSSSTTISPSISTALPGSTTIDIPITSTPIPPSSSTSNPPSSTTISPSISTALPGSTTIDIPLTSTPIPPSSTTPNPNKPTLPTGLPNPADIVYRLPTDILPVKYKLYWHPNFETNTCKGFLSVQIEVYKETNLIVLHVQNLDLQSVSILNMMARMRIVVKEFYVDEELQLLFIVLGELIRRATPYTLSIEYTCKLDGLTGMYTSSYLDQDGKEKWIATSKFEPTYARQAFPCFDEPAMKAQFTITIVRPSGDGYHALSNMNVLEEEEIEGGLTEVTFAESEPMSTYLACFIVSDFAHKSHTVSGVLPNARDFEMRVFSTPAQVEKVNYALETGVAITEYYTEYFQVAYPLPKLDMAAIPDFVSGAMEHWGLVTFRETALMYDPISSSSANKQRVATVVAHELAHMWFGNLVTMKWWNDLWLNEGFASYIEYKGVDKVHPDWQMLDQFLVADLHGVMELDATLASHAIVQMVESPSEITENFNSITYSKGAAVIRMLEDLVGPEKFRSAITSYLFKFYYSNADTEDFLTEMEAQGFDFDVKNLIKSWTDQTGMPVIEVEKTSNTVYTLRQKRFLSNSADYNVTAEINRWSIPITYFTSANANLQRSIFNLEDTEITITVPSTISWVKLNKNQVGYYRVNYPAELWKALTDALLTNRNDFSVSDRAHLISDAFALADATQLEYSIALDLTRYLENELDYVPWSVATVRLNALKNQLYYSDHYRSFAVYVRQLVSTAYETVTWTVGTDHLQNLLRVTILKAACGFGHEKALEEAATRFTAWLANPDERPSADIRSTVYYYGMQAAGNEKTWQQVWELFVKEQDAQEKIKLMESLAAVKEPWILQRYINLAWDEKYVRGQDYFTCLQNIASNRIGQSLVWDYVRENWEKLVERFSINERKLGRLIPSITERFATPIKLEEMETFFTKYPDAGAGTAARKEALETVKYNIHWLTQNQDKVGNWLASQESASGDHLV